VSSDKRRGCTHNGLTTRRGQAKALGRIDHEQEDHAATDVSYGNSLAPIQRLVSHDAHYGVDVRRPTESGEDDDGCDGITRSRCGRKSRGPDGQPCGPETRGLLQRTKVSEDHRYYISKEADRHWEHGEDLSLLRRTPTFGEGVGKMVRASAKVRAKIRSVGVREMMRRTKQSQHTIERIVRGERVRARTLQRVIEALK